MNNNIKYFFKKNKNIIYLLFLLNLIIELIELAMLLFSSNLIDSLINKNFSYSYKLVTIMIIITIINIIITYIFNISKEKTINNFAFFIELKSFNNIYLTEYKKLEKKDKNLISQKILKDSINVSNFIINNFFNIFINAITIISLLIILNYINISFFIISLSTIPIYFILVYYISKHISNAMYIARENRDIYSSNYIEKVNNIYIVKAFSILYKVQENFKLKYKNKLDALLKEYRIFYYFYSVDGIFTMFVQTIFFILGINYISKGQLSIGEFTIILTFYQMLIKNFNYYLMLGKDYEDYKISINRLNELKVYKTENKVLKKLPYINEIQIKKNSYELINDKILHYPEINISTGDILKINADNGAGKTTLINILTGIHNTSNIAYINKIDVHNIDMEELRNNNISYLPQNFEFIEGTALENINFYLHNKYNKKDILNNINYLEIKLDNTFVNEVLTKNINTLSVGQKQLIALIIVLLKDSEVLILDEPFNGLDIKNKHIIINYLKKIKNNKIILLVDHNESIALDCINVEL